MPRIEPIELDAATGKEGEVSDAHVAGLREYGYTDEQIAVVVALVALQLLTGAFILVAGIEPADGDDASNESPSARRAG